MLTNYWVKDILRIKPEKEARGLSITNARDSAKEVFVQAVIQRVSRLLRRHQWVYSWQST